MMSTILVIVASLLTTAFSTSVASHLTQADRSRYKSIFASSLTTTSDLPTLHYSILGTSLLGEAVPDSGTLCAHLGASAKETNVEALFQASTAAASLGCPLTLGPEAAAAVKAGLAEGATTASIYFSAKTQVSVKAKLDSAATTASIYFSAKTQVSVK